MSVNQLTGYRFIAPVEFVMITDSHLSVTLVTAQAVCGGLVILDARVMFPSYLQLESVQQQLDNLS